MQNTQDLQLTPASVPATPNRVCHAYSAPETSSQCSPWFQWHHPAKGTLVLSTSGYFSYPARARFAWRAQGPHQPFPTSALPVLQGACCLKSPRKSSLCHFSYSCPTRVPFAQRLSGLCPILVPAVQPRHPLSRKFQNTMAYIHFSFKYTVRTPFV